MGDSTIAGVEVEIGPGVLLLLFSLCTVEGGRGSDL